jgi:hypothetical protein
MCPIFANESFFDKAYPITRKSVIGLALRTFMNNFGVPESLRLNQAAEGPSPNIAFVKALCTYGINHLEAGPQGLQRMGLSES